ncbi:Ig-like domain-containing protein [Aeromonas jandaei]|uniref:Ig-like domain-containing protein n=1 Tax=Aeromonas jandaei TaxID=650 RepID=UPI003D1C5C4D
MADATTATLAADELTVTSNDQPANGTATNEVQALVRDASGNPVSGVAVAFAATNEAELAAQSVTTGDDGVASVTLTSTVAGVSVVTATVNGASQSVNTIFVADAATSLIRDNDFVVTSGAVANGEAANTLTATVRDNNGNPVPDAQVTFVRWEGSARFAIASTTTNPDIDRVVVATNAAGVASTDLVSTIAGNNRVTGGVRGLDSIHRNVTFVADVATATLAEGALTVVDNNALANGAARNTVQARVTDANGNPVSGVAVAFAASNNAVLSAASAQTDAAGLAVVTLVSNFAGVVTVTATHGGQSRSVDVNFSAASGIGTMRVTTNGSVANGVAANVVEVTVVDLNGNLLPNVWVTMSASNGATVHHGRTGANGVLRAPVTSTRSGDSVITASRQGSQQEVTVLFVANTATAGVTMLTGSSGNVVANGTATHSVEATVLDANGNPVSGAVVAFSATNGATIAATGTTGADGRVAVTLTSRTAGASTVTASHRSTSATTTVQFVAGAPSADRSTLAAGAASIVAGGTGSPITLTLLDANNNLVTGQTVTFASSNGGSFTAVQANANGIYTSTFTSTRAGTATITANVGGNEFAVRAVNVAVTPGAPSADSSTLTARAASIVAGGAGSPIALTLRDANDNPVTGQTVLFLSSNGGRFSAVQSNANGIYTSTFTSTRAGTATITANVGGNAFAVEGVSVDVTPGSPDGGRSSTVANPASITADGVSTSTIRLTLVDRNNNPITGADVVFTTDRGSITATPTESQGGVYQTTLTSGTQSGTANVRARVNNINNFGVSSVVFTPGAPSTATSTLAAGSTSIMAGTTSRITLTLRDANNNPVTGQEVTFASSNGGSFSAVTANADGTYISNFTGTTLGTAVITANVGGNAFAVRAVNVTVTPGAPVALHSTVTSKHPAIAFRGRQTTITLTARDSNNNNTTLGGITFSVTGVPGASVSTPSQSGNVWTVNLQSSGDARGTAVVTANYQGASIGSVSVTVINPDSTDSVMGYAKTGGAAQYRQAEENCRVHGRTLSDITELYSAYPNGELSSVLGYPAGHYWTTTTVSGHHSDNRKYVHDSNTLERYEHSTSYYNYFVCRL